METNMSNILLQIVAISWFVNIIESVESVNYICPDTHKLIQRKLTILGVYDENESVINFNQKSTEKVENVWRTPEICEWKDVIGKIKPENNICNIVAVYLSTQEPTGVGLVTPTKNYTPYECFKMPVNNAKSKLGIKPRKEVIYCPKTNIKLRNEGTSHEINSFLIGRGDYRRNSIRVYRFHNGGKSMDLTHYMYNVLTYSELRLGENEFSALRRMQVQNDYVLLESSKAEERYLNHRKEKQIVDDPSNKKWCGKSVEDNVNTCGDLSVFRIFRSDAIVQNNVLVSFDSAVNESHLQIVDKDLAEAGSHMPSNVINSIDKSGFLAYLCINRPVQVLDSVFRQDMIFCPQQIIVGINNKQTFRQAGFFYSTNIDGDSYFIYDVNYRKIDGTKLNDRGGTVKANANVINDAAIEKIHDKETDFEVIDSITLSSYVKSSAMRTPYTWMHK